VELWVLIILIVRTTINIINTHNSTTVGVTQMMGEDLFGTTMTFLIDVLNSSLPIVFDGSYCVFRRLVDVVLIFYVTRSLHKSTIGCFFSQCSIRDILLVKL
jgi:hypothetical protein